MIIVFDTETTGLFRYDRRADQDGQPRMCSLAAALLDDSLNEVEHMYDLVQPSNWEFAEVPEEARRIHGLDAARLKAAGKPVTEVLARFNALIDRCATGIAGFGVEYDLKMFRAEARRAGQPDRYGERPVFCVMRACTPLCKIPPTNAMMAGGRKTFKMPRLAEAHEIIVGEPMDGAHDALVDVRATVRILAAMKAKGHPIAFKPQKQKIEAST